MAAVIACNECGRPGAAAEAPGAGSSITRFTPCDVVYLDGCAGVFELKPKERDMTDQLKADLARLGEES